MNPLCLIFAAALASASGFTFFHPRGRQDAEHCKEGDGIRALNWDTTCSRYFQCINGLWTVRSCQTGTVIDLSTGRCTHPDNTVEWIRPECRDGARQQKLEEEAALLRQERERFPVHISGNSDPDVSNTAPYVGRNPYLCAGHNPHIPIAHRDCQKYRQCVNGFWHTRECNPGTVFDVSRLACAHRHLAWGCGLKAENAYKKQLEEWVALSEQAEEERERLEGPTEPTVFANFGGIEDLGLSDFPEVSEDIFTPEPQVAEPVTEDAATPVLQEAVTKPQGAQPGSPCAGTQLLPVIEDCAAYLECAPDALHHSLLLRQCPANTFFEPATGWCDYKDNLERKDCEAEPESSKGHLPSANILQDLINLAQN